MITIALAKGRLAQKGLKRLTQANILFSEFDEQSRKLIFESDDKQARIVFVKAMDVPIYVANGIADVGIVGKDVLLENNEYVNELADIEFGACRLCVCGLKPLPSDRKPVIASKYPRVTEQYFSSQGIDVDIIKLEGSVELAPLLELSDAIVDIVESGLTLKENNLSIFTTIALSSARLIVNPRSYKTKIKAMTPIIKAIMQGDNV
ncbi:MAG: ATP phosphoribosyltransferase [Erysipelothrix sp.]|jgi:ATP phosphoribosyltransferase|nr:ATP phosphoribosyltransferase [Erysipelothrix sp.]